MRLYTVCSPVCVVFVVCGVCAPVHVCVVFVGCVQLRCVCGVCGMWGVCACACVCGVCELCASVHVCVWWVCVDVRKRKRRERICEYSMIILVVYDLFYSILLV